MHTKTRLTSALLGAFVFIATTVAVLAPQAGADPTAAVAVIRLDGRGHGHGVGMSQWGAYTMARNGASAAQIIGAFYPGTQLANQGGEVVVVIDKRDHVRLRFPGGGEVRSARSGAQHAGFPVSVPAGGTVDIVRSPEGYRVRGGSVAALDSGPAVRYSDTRQDCLLVVCSPGDDPDEPSPPDEGEPAPAPAPQPQPEPEPGPQPQPQPAPQPQPQPEQRQEPVSPTPVWAVPAGGSLLQSVDRNRTYRGLFEVTGPPGGVRVRNHLDIEDYLKGMAEVPGTWPAAAVQAQAIAARTYALRAMAASGELCDSESCQVYVGTAHESRGQVAAVDATRGVVVTYGGALASTFYSASGGGFAANVAEGFGSRYDVPYLPAHPYETARPDIWSVDIALTDVARRLGYRGALQAVSIDETGPSGRPLRMTLHGDAGAVGVDPQDFRRRLGLRSTLFTVRTASTEVAPPPPPATPDPGVVGDASAVVGADLGRAGDRYRPVDRFHPRNEVALGAPEAARRQIAPGPVAVAGLLIAVMAFATAHAAGLAPADRARHAVAATLSWWRTRRR